MTATAVLPARSQLTRDDLVEDATWLVETGECWSQAVIRLGYAGHADALERRLYRAGRADLFAALRARETDPDLVDIAHRAVRARRSA